MQTVEDTKPCFPLFNEPEYQDLLARKREQWEEMPSKDKVAETFAWTTTQEYQDLNFKREALTINPAKEDVDAIVRSLTGGYGCDVYIEATGNPVGVNQGLQIIRKLGRFVEFSVFGKEATADWSIIGDRKELDIRGAHLSPYTYPVAIDLLERGLVTSKGIVTDKYSLSDWEAGFECAHSVDSIKVLLVPDEK